MPSQPSADRTRKTRVRRGIYYRTTADGKRRYCIVFTDAAGKQVWRTVDGGLKDAEAALAEIKSKLSRGERVATTKLTLAEFVEPWLAQQSQLRPRTRDAYATSLRIHV